MNPPRRTVDPMSGKELQTEHPTHEAPESGAAAPGRSAEAQDWRQQSEPGAPVVWPERMPVEGKPPAEPQKLAAMEPAPLAALPGAPYVAGTPISIVPYTAAGHPTIYVMGNEQLGSEFALQMSVRNQVHLPALKV